MSELERRTFLGDVEFRAEEGSLRAIGYAAMFGSYSQNLGGFVERIAPGAFTKTIQEADVRALFNHDQNMVLGRNKSGTLRLKEDRKGLAYEIDLPDTTLGRDLAKSLERGDISGSSFGFRAISDEWGETEDGFPLRTLLQVALRDVGPVTFPAYTDASSSLRSLAESRNLDLGRLIEAAKGDRLQEYLLEDRSNTEHSEEKEENEVSRETPTSPAKFRHLLGGRATPTAK